MSSGKVKCTCGWSWNKSDSSKKDMYICHECGRDNSNNMKNGGWLDNYGEEDNYNDSQASAPEGMEGDGYSNVGRDYSPAWGGQFQTGGKLKFLQPTSEKLPEGYRIPYSNPSSERAMSIGGENGEPAYLIPSFKYGKPLYNAAEEFKNTGEHLGGPFKTWQEADKWENETRHPAVERKENIMFPQEQFQMGGSVYPVNYVPQAQAGMSMPGSVGFTYARTQGAAPSNGKYAKKTMASAQNGKEMQYYQNGLDFKPKSISRDGSVIKDDRGQWDHPGEVTEINSNEITMQPDPKTGKPLTRPILGVSDTGDVKIMRPGGNYKFDGKKVTEYPMAQEGTKVMDSRQKRGIELLLKEKDKANKDESELRKTGRIKNPRSISYQNKVPAREEVRTHVPQSKSSKAWEVATHPMTAVGYAARNEELPDNFSKGAINAHEQAVDIINPFYYADQAGQFAKNVATGHPLDAGLNALNFIPVAAEFAPQIRAIGKGVGGMAKQTGVLASDLSKAKNIKEAVGRLGGLPIEGSLPRLSPQDLKTFRQVQEVGRLRATNKPISQQYKYALEQDIPEEHLQKVFGKTKAEIESAIPTIQNNEALASGSQNLETINLQRQPRFSASTAQQVDRDRLRQMMQGWDREADVSREIPANGIGRINSSSTPEQVEAFNQRVNELRRSSLQETSPSNSIDDMFEQLNQGTHSSQTRSRLGNVPPVLQDNSSLYRLDEGVWENYTNQFINNNSFNYGPGKVENFVRETLSPLENIHDKASSKFMNAVQDYPYHQGPVMENVPMLTLQSSGSLKNVSDKVANAGNAGMKSGDIYTGSLNTSHSSYLPQLKQVFKSNEGAPQFFGYKPMNSMGFLSDYNYSKDDIAKYLNTEIDEQIKRGIIPKNVQRPYAKDDEVLLPHYGIKQFKGGGSINQQDEKTLEHLDQLTNFTNYNKPQPGGWLNKYN